MISLLLPVVLALLLLDCSIKSTAVPTFGLICSIAWIQRISAIVRLMRSAHTRDSTSTTVYTPAHCCEFWNLRSLVANKYGTALELTLNVYKISMVKLNFVASKFEWKTTRARYIRTRCWSGFEYLVLYCFWSLYISPGCSPRRKRIFIIHMFVRI